MKEDYIEYLLVGLVTLLGVFLVMLIVSLGYLLYREMNMPACVRWGQERTVTETSYVLVGQIMVPQVWTHKVRDCLERQGDQEIRNER